jgi:DedD protein
MSEEPSGGTHLTDKQIVFGVMMATAALVVAFLCGIFVGRGVLAKRPLSPESSLGRAAVQPDAVPAATDVDAAGSDPGAASGTISPPPENLTYPDRLTQREPAAETLKAPPAESLAPQPPPDVPQESADEPTAASPPASAATPVPDTGGYTVQVAAVQRKAEADTIVARLVKKGFPAFIFAPPAGDRRGGFRVRVGSYKSRQEAENMAGRLQKEEQFKPWITR